MSCWHGDRHTDRRATPSNRLAVFPLHDFHRCTCGVSQFDESSVTRANFLCSLLRSAGGCSPSAPLKLYTSILTAAAECVGKLLLSLSAGLNTAAAGPAHSHGERPSGSGVSKWGLGPPGVLVGLPGGRQQNEV